MRAGPLRSAPLAGLVSAHHAVHAGPCSVIGVASAWRKKLQTHKCGSAYPNCAICSPRCYCAGGTALSTCCIGPSGEDDINSKLCPATIESADRLRPHSIYNCSIRTTTFKTGCRRQLSEPISVMIGSSGRNLMAQPSQARTGPGKTPSEVLRSKIEAGAFDVFLCHSNRDKPQVRKIALDLKAQG